MVKGKSAFSWQVPVIHGGDPGLFTKFVMDLGLDAVELKGADGPWIYYAKESGWGPNVREELVQDLRIAGIETRLWHFVYGSNVVGELAAARKLCDKLQPSVYVWDSEGAFEIKSSAISNARYLGAGLKSSHPHIKQALCTWALPKSPTTGAVWHPITVINAWLENMDAVMPMMYWQGSTPTNAIKYYDWSIGIWNGITDLPIIPVGRAYDGDGGYANPPAITAFSDRVYISSGEKNVSGISWYSLDELYKNPSWAQAIRESQDFLQELTVEEKVNRLVKEHPYLFPELF